MHLRVFRYNLCCSAVPFAFFYSPGSAELVRGNFLLWPDAI